MHLVLAVAVMTTSATSGAGIQCTDDGDHNEVDESDVDNNDQNDNDIYDNN